MLRFGWANVGNKEIGEVGLNLLAPADVPIYSLDSAGEATPLPAQWHLTAPDHVLNAGMGSHYMARRVEARRGESVLMNVAFDLPMPGRFPIEFKLFHAELQPAVRTGVLIDRCLRPGGRHGRAARSRR